MTTTKTTTSKAPAKAKATAAPTKLAPRNARKAATAKATAPVKKQTARQKANAANEPVLVNEALQSKAARAELATLKEWQKNGEKGKRPATPNYDAISERAAQRDAVRVKGQRVSERAMRQGKSGGKSSTPRVKQPKTRGLRYFVNGRPQTDHRNQLATIAFANTAGIGGKDVPRIEGGVTALVALLKKLGVTDPYEPFKETELPNGNKIALRKDSEKAKTVAKAASRKAIRARQ